MAVGFENWKSPWRAFGQRPPSRKLRTESRRDRRQRRLAVEPLEQRLLLALLAQWDFDEGAGNLATDSSGNGHTGQLFGPSWVQQGSGYAISLDGRDDYGDFGSNQNIGIGETLSLEAWIQPTTKAHGEAVIMGTDLHSYMLTYYNSELTYFYIGSGANNVRGHVKVNEWNHVVATFEKSTRTMNMSINGELVNTRQSGFSGYSPFGNFIMGTKDRPDLPKYKGLIDSVRVYDHVLSTHEAETHFLAEAQEYGFDPDLFVNPQVTSYFYLHDDEPTIVVDAEYVRLDPYFGHFDVTIANTQTPNDILVQRGHDPLPTSGFAEVNLPVGGLANGDYVVDVTFADLADINFTNQFTFSLPVESPPVVSPSTTTVGALPSDDNLTPYGFSLNGGGGFDVTINGTSYPFHSRISWPQGSYNHLADTASGEAAWQVNTQNLGANRYRVTAGGNYYSVDREIEVFPTHVSVQDTYTNDWNQDLGLLIYNEVPISPGQVDQSLLSGYDRYGRQIEIAVPDYGPSTFFSDNNTGLGIVPVDDVFIVQAIVYVDWEDAAGVGTEKFALAPGDSYTLEWAVYPTGSKDYYDFVNAFRTVEGRIARIEKTPGFITQTPHVPGRRDVPTQEFIDKRSLEIGLFHSLSEIADDPNLHIEGIEFRDFPLEMQLLSEQVAEIHANDPDFDVALHIAHSLYTTNNPDQFADSKVISMNGTQASWGDGSAFGADHQADGWRWWGFYPTPGNSFHDALIDSVDVLMDDMGFDGGFMDGFMAAYTGQYTYDGTWDGHTATISSLNNKILHKMGSVVLLSQPSLIEYARKIRDKGGVVIANNGVLTRSITAEDYIIFDNEVASGPEMHLAPSVTALANGPFLSEKHIYYDMLDKLSWGELFIYYTVGHELTHPSLASMEFPITFREIDSGMVRGDEKVVTMNSGIYGWTGDNDLHLVHKFDARGAPAHHEFLTTIGGDVRTELTFLENESAVLEQIPLTVTATSTVNARVEQYDQDNVKVQLNGNGFTILNVRAGQFVIEPGVVYEVTSGGNTSTVVAKADASLDVYLALSGQQDVVIGNTQVGLDIFSVPVAQVSISGSSGLTNYSTQIDEDSQVTLTAPGKTGDPGSSDHLGFIATQGLTGIQIFDSNGGLLKTLYSISGRTMEFDADGNLYVGSDTPIAGKYPVLYYPYLGDSSWGPASTFCQIDGRPRALALDSERLYVAVDEQWYSNVYTCAAPGQTPVLFGGANDNSRQIQDMEIDPDGHLWTSRPGVGYERFPLSGGFSPNLTIFNHGRTGGFEFGPDRNGDGKLELYGNVDDTYSNIGYYDYQTGDYLGTLISDPDIDNSSLTFGADRNADGVADIHILDYYERVRIYDGLIGSKLGEFGNFRIPLMYVSGVSPKPFNFLRWTLNGVGQTIGQNTISFTATGDTRAIAIYTTDLSAGDVLGDYNRDGQVDTNDYLTWFNSFGSATDLSADGNANGVVDAADYTVWQDNRGTGSTTAVNTSMNNPVTAELAIAEVNIPISDSQVMVTSSAVSDQTNGIATMSGARFQRNLHKAHDDAIGLLFEATDDQRVTRYVHLPRTVMSGRPVKPDLAGKFGFPTGELLREKRRRFQPLQAVLEIPPALANDDRLEEGAWQRAARRQHKQPREHTLDVALELAIDETLPW